MKKHAPLPATPTVLRRRSVGSTVGRERGGLLGALLLLCGLCAPPAAADPARVDVLLSETAGAYGELLHALRSKLDATLPGRVDLVSRLVPDETEERAGLIARRPALIVTVGIRASALMLREANGVPVLGLLVPYDSYNSLPHATDARHSAIYLDQPLERQLDLLRLLLPKANHLATLAGPHSTNRAAQLKILCDRRGLQLAAEPVTAADNPVAAVSRLMDRAEALLALPDPAVFNRNNLQAILLTTYRSGVPVFGFSQAYVRAGALAAVHSTAAQIGTQAAEWIAELSSDGKWRLGAPRYPAYYSVAVNTQVAQTLGIKVADERTLLERLRRLDAQRNASGTDSGHAR